MRQSRDRNPSQVHRTMDQEDLEQTIGQLESAVRAAMSPETSHEIRMRAYQTCEEFKESSDLCAQCGVIMASKNRDPITRHFGFQLIEHCVKFRWNKIAIDQKQFLKENTLKMISAGTMDLLKEQIYIKDALSRIVVEMIKREWPQQWPSMLSELNAIYNMGPTQTELVLLIFLRLAEDILIFQSAPNQRRRDILQGLTNAMPQLFPCFVNTLESNIAVYKQALVTDLADGDKPASILVSSRVASGVLETITAFIDWVNISYIIDQDGRLLRILCAILDDVTLRLHAVECLLALTNRKGKLEDRQPLLILFRADAMTVILNAAVVAATAELDEHNYIFLKRLCQVLTALGSQLCALWGSVRDVGQPATLKQFLEALLAFTDHPSLVLCGLTLPTWSAFFKHKHISTDSVLLSFICQLVCSAVNVLVKTGFPSQNNSPRCRYSRLDFDSDEDFLSFFARLRAECADMLRCAAALCPEMFFHFIAGRINDQLKKPLNLGEGCDHGHCNLSSPSFLEWDALTVFLESVMSRFIIPEKDTPLHNEGLLLFNSVLSYDTMDPMIRSAVLSVVSALFPYIVHSPEILPFVLEKIFSTVVFNVDGQTKATRSRAVKNVRRHACSVLVKICKLYPGLLLPGFSELYRHIQHLSSDPDGLSQMEKCTLTEALILINNQNKNFEKQLRFLSEIIAPLKVTWLSTEVKEALSSADSFIKFVGLHQPPVEPSIDDFCGINRSQLAHCVVSILATIKRSHCPESAEESAAGGFISVSESGVSYTRNPVTPVLMSLMDNVLKLCRTVNELYLPENLNKRHPDFNRAYDLQEIDKMIFLGVQPPLIDNTNSSSHRQPLDRMQSFITVLHENCFHILGNVGHTFGYEFYRMPNLALSLMNSCCMFIEALPEFRLRAFLRCFLKQYVYWCPKEFYPTAVLPVLARIAKHFHERLCSKWEVINQKCEERSNEDENSESQEVLEEMIVRHLTREYLDFFAVIFREKNKSSLELNDEMMTDDCETKKPTREEKIGELGILILQDCTIFPTLVHTLFMALSWNDTFACCKAINWCVPVLKQLMVPPLKLSGDDAVYLLGSVLTGLRMHGQHDALQASLIHTALQIYELLVPEFSKVKEVMLQVSSCSAKDLQKFTDLTVGQQSCLGDKKKKEMFKSLIQDAIGTHRRKAAPLVDLEIHEIGLCALFGTDADD